MDILFPHSIPANDPGHMDSYFLLVMEHLRLLSLTFWIGVQAINLVLGSSGMACLTGQEFKKKKDRKTGSPARPRNYKLRQRFVGPVPLHIAPSVSKNMHRNTETKRKGSKM